jgi:ubiquitin carboxyl-terminal hydrolase 34
LSNYLLDKDISSKYHLVGVVVHIGAAEFGHYFSYIDVGKNKWIEFNDSKVKVFNVDNLENQCFGGP